MKTGTYMKMSTTFKFLVTLSLGLSTLIVSAQVTTIIGGAIGNGNFNNGATDTGAYYSDSPNWHWASGDDSTQRFLYTSLMNGSTDPGSGGGYVYQSRLVVNDTGYTIGAAGEVFSLSYEFGAGGAESNYGNDEFLRAYLFTASVPVDANLTTGGMSQLGGNDDYYMNRNGGVQWTSHSQPNLYTTTVGDVGETVYLAVVFTNPTAPAPAPNPRLENILLTVESGGVVNLPPEFTDDPMSRPAADESVNYTGGTLAGSATDPEGDTLSYSKLSGPGWLQIKDDGTLFGVPGSTVAGMTNSFSVQVDATGGSDTAVLDIYVEPAPVVLDGWEEFVQKYTLSGDRFADHDLDSVLDVYEYAHGGNPTNPADKGIAPYVEYGAGDVASFISLETTQTNPGISYTAEWTDNLTTGKWQKVWDSETRVPAAIPGYDKVTRQINGGAAYDDLFCRSRLFPSVNRPNILFILADDLGYEDVSFNAPTAGVAPEIHTPELDHLATEGTIFTSAYVVHPFCGPSRMGLMSGRYPHEFGGPFNLPDESTGFYTDQGISTNETLLSTMLQDADYYTGIMGKWHMGQQPEFHPNARGFDEFYGFLGGGIIYWGGYQIGGWDYYRYPQHNGVNDTSLTPADHMTDVLTAKGTNFIHQAAATDDPFFLFMSYNAPHSVLTDSRGGVHPVEQAHTSDMALFPSLAGNRQIYAGLVYGMDRCVGELVDALKASGQYENTLIVFLSDNGGRTDTVGSGKNGVLRGRKGDVTEGGFRVPMFMHWPGVIPSGVTYDHPITALDFYQTFARLADTDVPISQDVDGKDIWDAVLGGTNARPGEPIYTVAYSTSAASVGIRQDQWKALKLGTANWELYNLDSDISETTDVSGTNASMLSNLVAEGNVWSVDHVQPLWWNAPYPITATPTPEQQWISNNMPHYETVFVLP